jgi:hypothetical protein
MESASRRAATLHAISIFPKPGEADQSILIMNVHPSAVVNPSEPRGLPIHVPFKLRVMR